MLYIHVRTPIDYTVYGEETVIRNRELKKKIQEVSAEKKFTTDVSYIIP